YPRRGKDAEADPSRDLQIALYGLAVRKLAKSWKLPERVGVAYVYADGRQEHERAFREDYGELEQAATGWLETAAGLLAEKSFPRTPDAGDCTYCSYLPVCGTRATERWARIFDGAQGALARFRALKEGG